MKGEKIKMAEIKDRNKVLDSTEDMVLEEIRKVVRKGEIHPNEWDNLKNAMCILTDICKIHHYDSQDEMTYSYGEYASGNYPATNAYENNLHGRVMSSYERGRLPITSRYIGRGDGYSGHSINDRMIDKLERMYDEASTQHEKDTITMWINQIRTNSMSN